MSATQSAQTDNEIAAEFIRGLESLEPESDASQADVRPEELLEELNSANSTTDIIESTGICECRTGMLDRLPVKELLDVQRSYQCYKKLTDEKEIKSARELRPGDFIAVKKQQLNPWWNYLIVTEVIGDVVYGVCLCTPNGDDDEKVNFVSNYSTSFKGLADSVQSPKDLKVWEVPLHWSNVHKVLRYDHLSCTDIVDEARKEIGNEYPWDIGKKFAEKVEFRLTKFANTTCIDMDQKLSLTDLLSIKQSYHWCTKSGDGENIEQIRDLRRGDHIAVKIKRSKTSCFNPWWNHMIVTGVDADVDISVIYVVCLCVPDPNPEKVMFESDRISFSHLKEYFRLNSRESNLQIWEIPLPWHLIRKVVRFDYAHSPFSPDDVVCRARGKLGDGETWDLYTHTSEHFAREIKTSEGTDTLRNKVDQGIALTCEVGMGTTALLVKKLHCGLKLVLWVVKQIIKLVFRNGPKSAVHLVNIAKLVRWLQFFGIGLGAIVDTIMCVIAIYIKYKRLKTKEITKNEFKKYVAQKVAEFATNFIFAIFCVPCLFIPIPVVGCVVSIVISILGYFVSKFVSWVVGKIWDCFHRD